jgi:CelD/BcsL family acetyltransferase involved in cellulose biosynthesis
LIIGFGKANFHICSFLAVGAPFSKSTLQVTALKLQVQLIDNISGLEPLRKVWDELALDVPFRSFDWLTTWWAHYGKPPHHDRRHLYVLVLRDPSQGAVDECVGIAPWYAERTRVRGTVLRPLGNGEVCSDHLSLLAQPEHAVAVAKAVATWLGESRDWDRLELDAVDQGDVAIQALVAALQGHGCGTILDPAGNCWAIDLPATWDEFLGLQSKSHRKQLRRAADRVLHSPRACWQLVESDEQFDEAWAVLVDLHQRRRTSLGQRGCFASPAFTAFHHDVARKLLPAGRLRLSWLLLDGSPIAAEYHVAGGKTTYAYQGGVDPDRLDDEPGRLSNIATLQHAIAEGHRTFDFLRGDEAYKAHWRALPHPTYRLRAFAPAQGGNWLTQTADWADSLASALKAGLSPLVSPVPHAF